MKECPILFSAPMVRAILDGRKTQTRRVVKPQPDTMGERLSMRYLPYWHVGGFRTLASAPNPIRCPYGVPGDRLWVRETWRPVGLDTPLSECVDASDVEFAATSDEAALAVLRWRPSIHMPRWASRILLEVVSVRVEPVQDISAEDVIAEGLPADMPMSRADWISSFSGLWDAINAKRGYPWTSNPWVWVVEFKRLKAGAA
jgi:hypothetical protein